MTKVGNNIKLLRQKFNLSQREFAKVIGISKSYVSDIECNLKNPGSSILESLQRAFGVDINWLITGVGNMFLESDHLLGSTDHSCHENIAVYSKSALNTLQIPVVGKVKAGTLSFEAEDIIDYIRIPGGNNIPSNAFALIVKGDSMSPTVKDSDCVIIAKTEDVISGDIVLIHDVWGDVCIKHFRQRDNQIIFTSDNSEYPPITPQDGHYNIIGKVVDIWRRVKT